MFPTPRSNSSPSSYDVLITGSGPVALTTALLFSQKFRVALVTRDSKLPSNSSQHQPHPPQRHFALNQRSIKILKKVGVEFDTCAVDTFQLFSNNQRKTLHSNHKPICRIAQEHTLLAALTERVNDHPNITVIDMGKDVSILTQDQSITASSNSQSNNAVTARLMVVADGARSMLCQKLNINPDIKPLGESVVANVVISNIPASTAMQWFDREQTIALLPIAKVKVKQTFSLIWSQTTTPSLPSPQDIEAMLQARLADSSIVVDANSISKFPIHSVVRPVVSLHRTAVIGDALRVIHPLAGQGLNLGLADSVHLYNCLRHRKDIGGNSGLMAFASTAKWRGEALNALTQTLFKQDMVGQLILSSANCSIIQKMAVRVANG